MRLIFAQNLRTILTSAEEQSLKISIKSSEQNSNKCHTNCKMYFASCLFIFSYSFQLHKHKQKLHIALERIVQFARNQKRFGYLIYNHFQSYPNTIRIIQIHIPCLTSWNNSIFDYKLRTDYEQLRLKILKKNSQP